MAERKHNFTGAELKAGALVLVAAALFIGFIVVIADRMPKPVEKKYVVYFSDTKGLNFGADVRIGGFKVGRVTNIDIAENIAIGQEDPRDLIRVEASVQADVPVRTDSEAFITAKTLMAEKHLEITTGQSTETLSPGSAIPTRVGDTFAKVDEVLEGLMGAFAGVEDLLGIDSRAQGGEELVTIADLFASLEGAMLEGTGLVQDARRVVSDNTEEIERIVDTLHTIELGAQELVQQLNNAVSDNRPNIDHALQTIPDILDHVAVATASLDELAGSLEGIIEKAGALTDTAGVAVANAEPAIEDLIRDLRRAVRNLNELMQVLSEQPESIIRGRNQGRISQPK